MLDLLVLVRSRRRRAAWLVSVGVKFSTRFRNTIWKSKSISGFQRHLFLRVRVANFVVTTQHHTEPFGAILFLSSSERERVLCSVPTSKVN